ncbi:hypothetical protein [Enterobacter kobei]|uniref:hypothetical protein n=1 Tax=Enterobacter kobei TaxID=208224 RepID=UPI003890772B
MKTVRVPSSRRMATQLTLPNYFDEPVSAKEAGIIVALYAYSHFCYVAFERGWQRVNETMAERYTRCGTLPKRSRQSHRAVFSGNRLTGSGGHLPALLVQEEMLMVTTDEVWFRYLDYSARQRRSGWHPCGSGRHSGNDLSPLLVPEGKRRVVRCRCGSNDWNEDGRWLGEYCCASCGQYIQVFEKKD